MSATSGDAAATGTTTVPETDIPVGNHTPKYVSRNPAIRWLTARFIARLDAVLDGIDATGQRPASVLEVGAGEGVVSERLHRRYGSVVALDLPDAGLRAEWRTRPGPRFVHGDARRLPFGDDAFDLVVCVEVLEHMTDPGAGLAELVRVSRRHVVASVPREPIFRGCNLVTGRYVGDLGNTPGHVNHWTARAFTTFVGSAGRVVRVEKPFPWTMAHVVTE
jgi:2-polyprenyl-3-methyl-5-hydroxy-6-metoxy-1,4-benzoquinol methylase